MRKISIHRALSELKLIDSKIDKKIGNTSFLEIQNNNGEITSLHNVSKEKCKTHIESNLQSILQLIDNKNKLKNAIVNVNAVTMVTINEKEMTIADAINYKSLIDYKKKLLSEMKTQKRYVLSEIENANMSVENKADKLANSAATSDNDNSESVNLIRSTYIDNNKRLLFDPINLDTQIDELNDEIETFESEVDSVLSEANAITLVELDF